MEQGLVTGRVPLTTQHASRGIDMVLSLLESITEKTEAAVQDQPWSDVEGQLRVRAHLQRALRLPTAIAIDWIEGEAGEVLEQFELPLAGIHFRVNGVAPTLARIRDR